MTCPTGTFTPLFRARMLVLGLNLDGQLTKHSNQYAKPLTCYMLQELDINCVRLPRVFNGVFIPVTGMSLTNDKISDKM